MHGCFFFSSSQDSLCCTCIKEQIRGLSDSLPIFLKTKGQCTHHKCSSATFNFMKYHTKRFSDYFLWWLQVTFDLHEQQQKQSIHQIQLWLFSVWSSTRVSWDILLKVYKFNLWWPQMSFELHESSNISYCT